MRIYLEEKKIKDIVRIYYNELSGKDIKVDFEVTSEDCGRYNEEMDVVRPKITFTKKYKGMDIEVTKTLENDYIDEAISDFFKDEEIDISYIHYNIYGDKFEGADIFAFEKKKENTKKTRKKEIK